MIDRVKIAEDSQRSKQGAYEKKGKISALKGKSFSAANEQERSEEHRYEVAEKAFLYGGKISG